MNRTTKWTDRFVIGVDKDAYQRPRIFLSAPTWDCDWYWSFGYLGNSQCHYHLDGVGEGKRMNMYDALKDHFGDSLRIPDNKLWTFCELAKTAYALKQTAEVLGRGGAHYSKNPCKDVIINADEVERINGVVLPAIFDAIHDLLEGL